MWIEFMICMLTIYAGRFFRSYFEGVYQPLHLPARVLCHHQSLRSSMQRECQTRITAQSIVSIAPAFLNSNEVDRHCIAWWIH